MKNINIKAVFWIFIIFASGVFYFCFDKTLFQEKNNTFVLVKEIIKIASNIMVYFSFLSIIFNKYLWKYPIFSWKNWLVKVPNLNGTWTGETISSWIDPKRKEKLNPIPTTLVINQTLIKINCIIYTDESKSKSILSDFIYDEENNEVELVYNYKNIPKTSIRERSEIHFGTAKLEILNKKLKGVYWTDRKTIGDLNLVFNKREKVKENVAIGNHPMKV